MHRHAQKQFLKRHGLTNDDFPGLLIPSVSLRPARNRTGCLFAAHIASRARARQVVSSMGGFLASLTQSWD
jgi:hypothetical protein